MNITKVKRRKDDRSIELTITDPFEAGAEKMERFADIRGGIAWPTKSAPAYFCIIGQRYERTEPNGKPQKVGERVMLCEYESADFTLTNFYHAITDKAVQYGCNDVHTLMPENRWDCGFLHDFDKFQRERNLSIDLIEAFDADNFLLGLSRIRESIDKKELALPSGAIVLDQMRSITREDLQQADFIEQCHATNALRHVLSSFYRDPPINMKRGSIRRTSSAMAA